MYEINNFTQKSEELTGKRNQTQEQLINDWMAEEKFVKYL